jgi:hypothetical protein
VAEVVGVRVRVVCEGRRGWGQMHRTESPGLGCDERIAGGLIF